MKTKSSLLIFDTNGNLDLSNYYTKSEIDTKLDTKANVTHSHNISDITNLQSQLNSKAASNHTHSNYATTAAVTNAQNTANNALNVANSKTTLNIYNSSQAIGTSPGYEPSSYTPPKNGCQNLHATYSGQKLYQRGVPLLEGSTVLVAANYPITVDRGGIRGVIYFI